VAATTVAATTVVPVMAALSPSPQSQQPAQRECIKKRRAVPLTLSETLEFHLNLYPFMVLCHVI